MENISLLVFFYARAFKCKSPAYKSAYQTSVKNFFQVSFIRDKFCGLEINQVYFPGIV